MALEEKIEEKTEKEDETREKSRRVNLKVDLYLNQTLPEWEMMCLRHPVLEDLQESLVLILD